MNKFDLTRRIIYIAGFVVSLLCFALIFVFSNLRTVETRVSKAGQECIDELEAMHIKGSYKSPYFDIFVFESADNPSLPFDIKAYFVDETIYCFLPQTAGDSLRVTYSTTDRQQLMYNSQVLSNNGTIDFKEGTTLYLGETEFQIVPVYTQLPYLSFETMDNNLVYSHGGYVASVGRMWDESSNEILSQLFQIRVRGNLTTAVPKLSYKIKTANKFQIYSLAKSDEWTLIANFYDPSMLRNRTAFLLAEELGMEYVPQMEYVELYLNGEYHGVYALTTQVGVHSGNVNLENLKGDLSGSYMLELDGRSVGREGVFDSLFNIPLVIKDPSVVTEVQRNMIQQELTSFETALMSEDFTANGVCYRDLIDMQSFADIYLVNEIMGNLDASAPFSLYVYKNSEGKLAMGPVWDFDLAAGNNGSEIFCNAESRNMQNYHWFARLNQDPVFCRLVKDEYGKLSDFADNLDEYSAAYISEMQSAANNNFISAYIGINTYSNIPSDDPFIQEVAAFTNWLKTKFAWIDANIDTIWN